MNVSNNHWSLLHVEYNRDERARLEKTYLDLDDLFPLIDPDEPTDSDKFFTDAWFNLDLRAHYRKDAQFRGVMNDFYLNGTTLNRRMEMGFKQVCALGGSFRDQTNGASRSGKSIANMGGVCRVYAEVAKRPLLFHGFAPPNAPLGEQIPSEQETPTFFWDVNKTYNERKGGNEEWESDDPINVYLTFNNNLTRSVFKRVKSGDIIMSDENSDTTGQMSREFDTNITNILEAVSGQQGINFLFLNPTEKAIVGLQLHFYIIGYNVKRNITRILVKTPGSGWQGVWEVYTLDPPGLRAFYKNQAAAYKHWLLAVNGKVSADGDIEDEKGMAEGLIEKFLEKGYPKVSKETLEYLAREPDSRISTQPEAVIARVIKRAHDELKFKILPGLKDGQAKDEAAQAAQHLTGEELGQTILLDRPMAFQVSDTDLLKTYPDLTKANQYLEIRFSGKQAYKIAEAYGHTSSWASTLANPKQEDPDFPTRGIPGWLAQERGNRLETYVEAFLREHYGGEIDRIEHETDPARRRGKPDYIITLKSGKKIVISVKCLSSPDGDPRPTYSIRATNRNTNKGTVRGKFQREITTAKQLVKEGCPDVELRGFIYNMRYQVFGFESIDFDTPPEVITATVPDQIVKGGIPEPNVEEEDPDTPPSKATGIRETE